MGRYINISTWGGRAGKKQLLNRSNLQTKSLHSFEKTGITRRHDITNQTVSIRNVIAAYDEGVNPNDRILSQFMPHILRTISKYYYSGGFVLSRRGWGIQCSGIWRRVISYIRFSGALKDLWSGIILQKKSLLCPKRWNMCAHYIPWSLTRQA